MTTFGWVVFGMVGGLLVGWTFSYWERKQSGIAETVCSICHKPFSYHWDEADAAYTYHEEYDCEET